jgi:hypothetical protein
LIKAATKSFDELFKADARVTKADDRIRQENLLLNQHYGEMVTLYGQRVASDKAASRDVEQAKDTLDDALEDDTLNDRDQAEKVIRALARAKKRLQSQP